ncbi:actin nucleation-promoting factor WAS-like [Zonotrichia leucophrys gambelii]|uniref:actin nucleation-promoting factor WAS-like n=1 Tax=Zonotrichia leucophrys gambelii TaxID=257770 RepID=UPI003140ADFE
MHGRRRGEPGSGGVGRRGMRRVRGRGGGEGGGGGGEGEKREGGIAARVAQAAQRSGCQPHEKPPPPPPDSTITSQGEGKRPALCSRSSPSPQPLRAAGRPCTASPPAPHGLPGRLLPAAERPQGAMAVPGPVPPARRRAVALGLHLPGRLRLRFPGVLSVPRLCLRFASASPMREVRVLGSLVLGEITLCFRPRS